jgi:acetyl esterase/lipase
MKNHLNSSSPPERLRESLDISVTQHEAGWNVFEIAPPESEPEQQIFYVHGGAYVHPMTDVHWNFFEDIVTATNAKIEIPAYPLAPHGTASKTIPALAELLESRVEEADSGLTLMGDSAGGTIALGLATLMRDRGLPLPQQTVLMSPWVDATLSNPKIDTMKVGYMSADILRRDAETWRGNLEMSHPWLSPVNADLRDLGRLVIFSGTYDLLHPDNEAFAEHAGSQEGTDVDFFVGEGQPHGYIMVPGALHEHIDLSPAGTLT